MLRLGRVVPLLLGLLGCHQPSSAPSSPVPSAVESSGVVSAPSFDLQALIDRAHFAYRPEGTEFVGLHVSYGARVTSAGELRVRARVPGEGKNREGAPLSVETVSLSRGASILHRGAALSARVSAEGAVVLHRGAVSEELANREAGVEQSWRFAKVPAGQGDLRVKVRLSGLAYTEETEHGLHFLDRKTGLGFRYGIATWIDASGQRVTLRPRFRGSEVEIVVPAEVVASASYPAVLDPILSPEYGTDAVVSTASNQSWGYSSYRTSVVFGGGTYLVSWEDTRGSDDGNTHVCAARVGLDGTVADPMGIRIAVGDQYSRDSQAAFDGTNFLVVWTDRRGEATHIYGQFLSPSGKPVGSNFAISTGTAFKGKPSVAFTGTAYEVLWQDARAKQPGAGTEIWGARVTMAGQVTERAAAVNSYSVASQESPTIACDGQALCLLVWTTRQRMDGEFFFTLRGILVDYLGEPLFPEFMVSDPGYSAWDPDVAWDPQRSRFLVAWVGTGQSILSAGDDIFARFVSAGGALGQTFTVNSVAGVQGEVQVAADGKNGYLVVWREGWSNRPIVGIRVASDGGIIEASSFMIGGGETANPSVASSGAGYLVAWRGKTPASEYYDGAVSNCYAARVASLPQEGNLLDENAILVSLAGNAQRRPSIAYDGTNYLIAWHDTRKEALGDIYAALVDSKGTVLASASTGLVLPNLPAAIDVKPAVAFDGTNYLIVWQAVPDKQSHQYRLHGARVSKDGTLLDKTPIVITQSSNNETEADIAFDGTNYLIVYREWQYSGGAGSGIAGALLSPLGQVTGRVTIVALRATEGHKDPRVAWGGSAFLVTHWVESKDPQSIYGTITRVLAALVSPSGTVTQIETPLAMTGGSTVRVDPPDVASSGADFLVVFMIGTVNPVNWSVVRVRVRVSASGAVVSPASLVSLGCETCGLPRVEWVSSIYVVGWIQAPTATGTVVQGTWLGPDGAIVGGGSLSPAEGYKRDLALAPAKNGRVMVSYARYDDALDVQAMRVRFGFAGLGGNAQGEPCRSEVECISGHCVDGVCCDVPCAGGASDCQACSVAAGAPKDGVCAATTGNACSDQDLCTQRDTCQAGTCVAGDPVSCPAPDLCRGEGHCEPAVGCVFPAVNEGGICADGDACTVNDVCAAGVCRGVVGPCGVDAAAGMDAAVDARGPDALSETDAAVDARGADAAHDADAGAGVDARGADAAHDGDAAVGARGPDAARETDAAAVTGDAAVPQPRPEPPDFWACRVVVGGQGGTLLPLFVLCVLGFLAHRRRLR